MPEVRDALERISTQVAPEPHGFERVRARRRRRERNRRIAAGALAFVIAAAGVATAATLVSRPPSRPVAPATTAPVPQPSAGFELPALPTRHVDLTTLHMVSPSDGWATSIDDSGAISVLRTTDGGSTWTGVTPPEIGGDQSGVTAAFLDATHAWVAWPHFEGIAGIESVTVFRTSDGGRSWSHSSFTSRPSFDGTIQFVDPQHGWVVATVAGAAGTDPVEVWRTVDGGATWTSVSRSRSSIPGLPPGTPNALPPCGTSATFVDRTTGFAVSPCVTGGELFITHDAGSSWFGVTLTPPFGDIGGPDRPRFTSPLDGFIPFLAPQGAGVARGVAQYAHHGSVRPAWGILNGTLSRPKEAAADDEEGPRHRSRRFHRFPHGRVPEGPGVLGSRG